VTDIEHVVVKPKEYLPLLWIVLAAVLGVSLLCGTAVIGVNDINQAALAGTPTVGVVDFFVANINTVIVATVEAFSEVVSMPTITPTTIAAITPKPSPTLTATRTRRPTATFSGPKESSSQEKATPVPSATFTAFPTATATFTETTPPTWTPSPLPTLVEPTITPSATPSDTPVPTDDPEATNTPVVPTPTISVPEN
jgi:hypothetical protein